MRKKNFVELEKDLLTYSRIIHNMSDSLDYKEKAVAFQRAKLTVAQARVVKIEDEIRKRREAAIGKVLDSTFSIEREEEERNDGRG